MSSCRMYEDRVFKSGREPRAAFFDGVNCTGQMMELEAGEYPTLFYAEAGQPTMGDKISSMWIPPHMSATLFAETGCLNTRPDCANTTCKCSGANMWNYSAGYNQYPFEYQAGGYPGIPSIGSAAGNNNAEALQLNLTHNWDDFLDACCRGQNGNGISRASCGPFWRGISEKETGSCDFRVEEYCEVNPNDPFCSCYEEPIIDPNNKEESCLKVFPKCYSNLCATKGYKPYTMKDIQCPKCTFCTQNINIQGKQNLFNDNIILMDCSSESGRGEDKTAKPGDNENVHIYESNIDSNVTMDPSSLSSGNVTGAGSGKDATDIIAAREAAKRSERESSQKQLVIIFIGILSFVLLWKYMKNRDSHSYRPTRTSFERRHKGDPWRRQ